MKQLIICKTDKGRYAVRPVTWEGIWTKDGKIREDMNHTAIFSEKADAEKFVEWKRAEEQGVLLKLTCKVGDTVYIHFYKYSGDLTVSKVKRIEIGDFTFGNIRYLIEPAGRRGCLFRYYDCDFGKGIFLTQKAAEKEEERDE